MEGLGKTFLHVKRGTIYRVLFFAKSKVGSDWMDSVVYTDADGNFWTRSKAEFFDGRFTQID